MLRADLRLHGDDTSSVPANAPAPPADLCPSTARKKVAFIIAHLGPGGAQRVAVNAANALVDRGFDVHVIEINAKYDDAYELDRRVARYRRRAPAPGHGIADWIVGRAKKDKTSSLLMAVRKSLEARLEHVKKLRWLRRNIHATQADTVLSFLTQTNILVVLATRGMSMRVVI